MICPFILLKKLCELFVKLGYTQSDMQTPHQKNGTILNFTVLIAARVYKLLIAVMRYIGIPTK